MMNKYESKNFDDLSDSLSDIRSRIIRTEDMIEALTEGSQSRVLDLEIVFKSGGFYTHDIGRTTLTWKVKKKLWDAIPFLKSQKRDEKGCVHVEYGDRGSFKEVQVVEISENKKAIAQALVASLEEVLSNLKEEEKQIEQVFDRKKKTIIDRKSA